jgi:GNAT superfamily N-acetyltransferase
MAGIIAESGYDFIGAVDALEARLDRHSLFDRLGGIPAPRPSDGVEILDYRPAFRKDFKRLNYEWLQGCVEVERRDERMLSDPDGTIIRARGAVFFPRRKGRIVGTCALVKHPDGVWELAKLAVTERARRTCVGTALAVCAANRARDLGAERLCLETSPTDARPSAFSRSWVSGKRMATGSRSATGARGSRWS